MKQRALKTALPSIEGKRKRMLILLAESGAFKPEILDSLGYQGEHFKNVDPKNQRESLVKAINIRSLGRRMRTFETLMQHSNLDMRAIENVFRQLDENITAQYEKRWKVSLTFAVISTFALFALFFPSEEGALIDQFAKATLPNLRPSLGVAAVGLPYIFLGHSLINKVCANSSRIGSFLKLDDDETIATTDTNRSSRNFQPA